MSSVTSVTGEAKTFMNIINWNPNSNLTFESNAVVDISKVFWVKQIMVIIQIWYQIYR